MPEGSSFTQNAMGKHRRVLSKVRDLRVWLVMAVERNHREAETGSQGGQQKTDAIVQMKDDSD